MPPSTPSPAPNDDARLAEGLAWAAKAIGDTGPGAEPIAGDASFRRYFRLRHAAGTHVLMDAPPGREDTAPFIDVAGRLRAAGLHAPEIVAADPHRGFLLLEDLGDALYRDRITPQTADAEFEAVFDILATMARAVDPAGLPAYDDHALQGELDLYTDWYLARHLGVRLEAEEREAWQGLCRFLLDAARAQPQVFVHKDFHSCNLLHTGGAPGVIDFQDALRGPVAYDTASLLWDRYVAWPRERLTGWMRDLHGRLGLDAGPEEWERWCDLAGLQRNLKIVGIFARLRYRDGKQGYVEMIPRFYRYLLDVAPRYAEFAALQRLLEDPRCAP